MSVNIGTKCKNNKIKKIEWMKSLSWSMCAHACHRLPSQQKCAHERTQGTLHIEMCQRDVCARSSRFLPDSEHRRGALENILGLCCHFPHRVYMRWNCGSINTTWSSIHILWLIDEQWRWLELWMALIALSRWNYSRGQLNSKVHVSMVSI